MPGMPRPDNEFKRIAYKILGKPENMKKSTKYSEYPTNKDRGGVDELVEINRVIPRNYF